MTRLKVIVWPKLTVGLTLDFTKRRSELGVTTSVSDAEHTPATVQDTDGLVLVNPGGGVRVATLRTEVCAWANDDSNSSAANHSHGVLTSTLRL
jgi:hypothetical protein